MFCSKCKFFVVGQSVMPGSNGKVERVTELALSKSWCELFQSVHHEENARCRCDGIFHYSVLVWATAPVRTVPTGRYTDPRTGVRRVDAESDQSEDCKSTSSARVGVRRYRGIQ